MMTADEIRSALTEQKMTVADLARATGLDQNHISKILGKAARQIRVHEMSAIEAVLRPEPIDVERIRTIPLLGEVPAGKLQPAIERAGRRVAVSDPETPHNAFALTVKGDSMDLVVPAGATLVIDPDDKMLWPGRRYVIRTEDGEATFKEYQEGPARLMPCSSNSSHREISIGSEPIVIVGRVFSYSMRDVPRRLA